MRTHADKTRRANALNLTKARAFVKRISYHFFLGDETPGIESFKLIASGYFSLKYH